MFLNENSKHIIDAKNFLIKKYLYNFNEKKYIAKKNWCKKKIDAKGLILKGKKFS